MKSLLRFLALVLLLVLIAPFALLAMVVLVPLTAPLLATAALLPLAVLALPFLAVYGLCRLLARSDDASPKAA
ncbi:hypothetical protein ED208_10615 [Stagnimonas aquatica]|uniref:Uncharacterized protein n=1 Tax=Stagnimonas aquatica TaxID=2689987 RepID=A0A3N0VA90_9GAMM|nr:hypothetical protein [Stagnimonas aquatica]ROH89572.1 hypothetical protein ED208_10615 [Stagnimonas aquatica]